MPKKPKQRTASGTAKLAPEEIERKSRASLAGGYFRDAIDGFKQLLKLEPRPDWRFALADAYAGRARALSAKGMLKEALAIWENRANLGKDIAFAPEQATLLLRLGRPETVCALLTKGATLPPAEAERLRTLLAARVLAGETVIAERLAPEDPVRRHAEPARAALAAYCAGDAAGLRAALGALPFRSPYRDWVQILKAFECLPERPREAADLLGRIGDDSAFAAIRQAAELALLPEVRFMDAIREAGKPQRPDRSEVRFACALRGWPPERIALWEEIDRLGREAQPVALLRLLYRHRDRLGANWVRQQSLRLLIRDYPASLKSLPAVGAVKANPLEARLVAAWHAEQSKDPWDVLDGWENYARDLIGARAPAELTPDDKLCIAMALRRADQFGRVLDRPEPSDDPDDLDWRVAELVDESLTWDPEDRDITLRLLQYYRRGKRTKDVRRLLDQVSERWPQDPRVLSAAMDVALDAGAFKKAAGLASRILAADPINTEVREHLVAAHLAHARKQLLKGRADLARKTLDEADVWARGGHAREQLDLTSGLIAVIEHADAAILRETVARLGGGLAAQAALVLAGDAVKLPPLKLFKQVILPKFVSQGPADLLAALTRLRTHLDGGGKLSRELDAYFAKSLGSAPWARLSRSDLESACDTLRRCGFHKLRRRVADIALKQWRGAPVFELHAFEAKYPKGFSGRPNRDLDRLDEALGQAREEGDMRTALRIKEIFDALNPFGFGGPLGASPFGFPFEDDFADDDDDDEPFTDGMATGAVIMMLRMVGLDKAMQIMDFPPDLKKLLKRRARQIGEPAVIEQLIQIFDQVHDGKTPDLSDFFR
ncbi:hypothetical protein [uncultured Thiocystis sp.]|jgi:tetratricopeptide (TPR) repeat protein|uniref:hypothetical protein n=1 Tax=uncultured Thiocystis sp. TaxID=1202134 RepID=UPI002601561E|nr:hypothetical protein [uncultured Thiocystis sp.]